MRFIEIVKYLCIVSLCINGSSNAFAADNISTQVVKEMEELREHYNLPSFSLAMGVGGEIVFAGAIGFADIEDKKTATRNTQYSVGSIAKPMTGIALAKLVDAKKIDLDSPVSRYVRSPSYTNSFSVRQLASHIAGIAHDTPERAKAEFVETKNHFSPFDAFYVFSSHPLLFEPATSFKYSSNGYILLSAVIEKAAEVNFVDFLQKSLWSPLEMKSTELDTDTAGKNLEATYYEAYESDNKYQLSTKKRDRSFLMGGGGFISTPSDLIRMSRATFDNAFLSDQAQLELLTPTRLKNGEINPQKYSLGWRVGEIDIHGQTLKTLHHGGVTSKASTAYLFVVPNCKASIAFATNHIPDKFWEMRPKMAEILKNYIRIGDCKKVKKSSKQITKTQISNG